MNAKIKKLIPNSFKSFLKLLINKYEIIKHTGNKYICPFCGYNADDLKTIGSNFPVISEMEIIGAGRRKGACFKCGSFDRERLVFIYLKKLFRIKEKSQNLRVLHLAPELFLSQELMSYNLKEYALGDKFMPGYSYPDYVKNMDVNNIPFPDSYFDLIICNHLLEHIQDDIKAMKELYRVLNYNGMAILLVPFSKKLSKTYEDNQITTPEDREKHFGQYDHVRIYGKDYFKRLESVGFKTKTLNISQEYSGYGLNPDEDLFLAYSTKDSQ